MRLQPTFAVAATVLVVLGVSCAAALMVAASTMRHGSDRMAHSLASVRAAQSIEVQLLIIDRERRLLELTGDSLHRREISRAEMSLRESLAVAGAEVSGDDEERIFGVLTDTADSYLEGLRQHAPAEVRRARFEAALHASERLVDVNVLQSGHELARLHTTDAIADTVGTVLASLLILALIAVLLVVRATVVRPLLALKDVMTRFRTGDEEGRTPPRGAAEVRELAEELDSLQHALRQHEQAQVTFLAGVAHDLRNPIAALKLSAGVLIRRPDPLPADAVRNTLTRVSEQAERLDRMVGDLLDRTRIEAGNLDLRREPCDLRGLVRSVVELQSATSEAHTLSVDAPQGPVLADCDPVRVAQVLNNLVSNAIKYSPAGGQVRIRAWAAGGDACIEVSDEGVGIPEAEHRRIFDPFHRSRLQSHGIPGVGLGLSVSRRIVEAHGGSIEVESTPGRGSTFRVRLPATSTEHPAATH